MTRKLDLTIELWHGSTGRQATFSLHTGLDKDYIKACFTAFRLKFTAEHGTPDRVVMHVA